MSRGLGIGSVMLLLSIVATGLVALELERQARTPIDRAYSPAADALVDRWGLPLRTTPDADDALAVPQPSANRSEALAADAECRSSG